MNRADRYRGCLLGLAAGDAVGTAVEFKPPGSFVPVTDMVGGGPFHLPAGAWTDDTSMALCLADSLLAERRFDPVDQLRRYVAWWRQGSRSSTGGFFDIGGATSRALSRFEHTGDPYPGDEDATAAGNGPLMKLAPLPLAYARHPAAALERAARSARTTHGAPEAADASRYLAALLIGALEAEDRDELLARGGYARFHELHDGELHPKVAAVAAGSFLDREPPEIRGGGYVVDALEAALWAVHRNDDFESAILAATNLGDDADTTAAIAGQLAGAICGIEGIPAPWRERVVLADEITGLADDLLELAEVIDPGAEEL